MSINQVVSNSPVNYTNSGNLTKMTTDTHGDKIYDLSTFKSNLLDFKNLGNLSAWSAYSTGEVQTEYEHVVNELKIAQSESSYFSNLADQTKTMQSTINDDQSKIHDILNPSLETLLIELGVSAAVILAAGLAGGPIGAAVAAVVVIGFLFIMQGLKDNQAAQLQDQVTDLQNQISSYNQAISSYQGSIADLSQEATQLAQAVALSNHEKNQGDGEGDVPSPTTKPDSKSA